MKYKFSRMLSLLLCMVVIYSTSLVNVAYSVDLQKMLFIIVGLCILKTRHKEMFAK